MFKKLATGLAALAGLAFAAPAHADPITLGAGDEGTTFSINLNGFVGDSSSTIDNLTSTLTFTLDSVSGDRYDFSYTVDNTTSGGLTSNISSFAFNVDPDIVGATVDGAYSYTFVTDGRSSDPRYPNQIGAVDVCFKAKNSGSCSNGGGVSEGNSGSGTLSLFFDPDVSEITLSDFFVRYQGISGAGNVGSASGEQISSTSGTTTSSTTSGTPVPAPGMLGLLALALVSLGFMRRRRDHVEQPAFA
ncbi:cistern family PEP-CTERM protein [Erythrobacter alti]|uniref:cistern family PEP-CTERM protein n=1 Tax=Erythrobacter alti TaxID=1896145 RepID=UPI0030F44396